jgi:L-ascorbate metabolism protein UlaG (beta-lactamase superfamily)
MKLKYFAHSAFQVTTEQGITILIDPFLDGNPNSPVKSSSVRADYIIITHAHGDHFGDAAKIAKRSGSTFICVFELANICADQGFTAHGMHIGGGYNFDFGRVKFTIAHHGSVTNDGRYAGEPAGVLLMIEGKTIYHCGDTALFSDMKLIGEGNKIDYMLAPIGDNFTMGIDDAVKAAELVKPGCVIPIHYNTFPVIQADPDLFAEKLKSVNINCRVLKYGEEIVL